ncbi:MAG: flagellar export protein FliJ [Sulfuricurvum sp.]|nr:flagellar export protein FliJ [Sulfuricurvum sp.]
MGISRYTPLVKLKKKSLDNAERALIAANNELSSASDKLNHAYNELSRMSLPTQGTLGEFTQVASIIHAQHRSIEEFKFHLENARQKQNLMRERFKTAMIDFEKFKYLEVQELETQLKRAKLDEAKTLDEIATLSYKREMP